LSVFCPPTERQWAHLRDLMAIFAAFLALKLDGLVVMSWRIAFLVPWMWFGTLLLGFGVVSELSRPGPGLRLHARLFVRGVWWGGGGGWLPCSAATAPLAGVSWATPGRPLPALTTAAAGTGHADCCPWLAEC